MILKNKIIELIKTNYNKNYSLNNDVIVFSYNGAEYSIYSNGLFQYTIKLNNSQVFVGNYFELIGFLEGLRVAKSNEIKVSDPAPVLVKIGNIVNSSISSSVEAKYKKEIQNLKDANVQLNAYKTASSIKNNNYKQEIQKLNKSIQQRTKELDEVENKHKKELSKKDLEISKLKDDCEEAALLISDLYYKASNITSGRKTYKLENFPQDVQSFIKEIIDEYYNK